jgi:hypothetical protein
VPPRSWGDIPKCMTSNPQTEVITTCTHRLPSSSPKVTGSIQISCTNTQISQRDSHKLRAATYRQANGMQACSVLSCCTEQLISHIQSDLAQWTCYGRGTGGRQWRGQTRRVTALATKMLEVKVKVKQPHYRPRKALRAPGGRDSQVFRQSAHEGGKVVSPTHRPPLPPRKYSWYSFLLEAESTPGPYCDRKDYVNEKFQ